MKKLSFIVALLCASMMAWADLIYDTNLATLEGTSATASSENGANTAMKGIDGDPGTRWESAQRDQGTNENPNTENIAWNDDQWWLLDLGEARTFNTIKINWEGAYAKEFNIFGSTNGTDWDLLYEEDNLTKSGWQLIEFSTTTAQYIKFQGIKRATQWGYSFYEFEVMLIGASVLTTIDVSASHLYGMQGGSITITAQGKDQLGEPMAAEFSYEVSPIGAGNFSDNVFTFAELGEAVITVRSGEVNTSISVYGVPSANLAYNKTCEAGFEPGGAGDAAVNVNDDNESTSWDPYANRPYNENWWMVDLGKKYNITGINVVWGEPGSTNYLLQVRDTEPTDAQKADDDAWTLVVQVTEAGNNSVQFKQVSATGRYLRLQSVNATADHFHLKEVRVFGTEYVPTAIDNTDADVKAVKVIENGQLVIIKNGVKYNVLGKQL